MTKAKYQLDSLDPESPFRGDWIFHLGPDGRPNGLGSHVQRLEGSDREEELYEVIDNFGVNRIITRYKNDTWIQVLIPR